MSERHTYFEQYLGTNELQAILEGTVGAMSEGAGILLDCPPPVETLAVNECARPSTFAGGDDVV